MIEHLVPEKHREKREFFVNEEFLPIDKESYQLLQRYKYCSPFQEKSITAIIAWQYACFGLYKIIDECLCAVFFHADQEVYWTIHRPNENMELAEIYPVQKIIDTLFDISKKADLPFVIIKFVEERMLDEFKSVKNYKIETHTSPDSSEYAYKVKDIIELSGNINMNKRSRVKKFLARDDISVQPMTNSNVRLCLDIKDACCQFQDCSYCSSFFGCEKKAMESIVNIFNEEIHKGLFLHEKDKHVGYIICEKISEKLAFTYFGRSLLSDGFIYLIYIMYKDYLNNVEYMNINEDMGHPGLRRFKRLLSAHELWHKYTVTYNLLLQEG